MADRIADNADHLLDETKRKARRRLVGAIVLALAAAVILPMLLEQEPRPLGDDVSVRIPPVDESKFINKLTGRSGDTKPLPKAEDKAAVAKTEPKSESTANPAAPPAPVSATPAASDASVAKKALAEESRPITSAPAPAASATTNAKSAPKEVIAETRPATPVETKPAAEESKAAPVEPKPTAAEAKPATATAPASAVPAKSEGFVVQLAAFADDKGANSLANKLKRAGYAAFVESVQTSRGTLWRVRVGGYATRPEADAARVKLKGEGFSGIVAPAS
jgi:DedD protein